MRKIEQWATKHLTEHTELTITEHLRIVHIVG